MNKVERIRRCRLRDLRGLFRSRYRGPTLPDDDAGREDLVELLLPISLGPDDFRTKIRNEIELVAPWMDSAEAALLIKKITGLPRRKRCATARALGERQRVTNAERQALRLGTIKPCDRTDVELTEQRKAVSRAGKAAYRRKQGTKSRTDYLAASISAQSLGLPKGLVGRLGIAANVRQVRPHRRVLLVWTDLSHGRASMALSSGWRSPPPHSPLSLCQYISTLLRKCLLSRLGVTRDRPVSRHAPLTARSPGRSRPLRMRGRAVRRAGQHAHDEAMYRPTCGGTGWLDADDDAVQAILIELRQANRSIRRNYRRLSDISTGHLLLRCAFPRAAL